MKKVTVLLMWLLVTSPDQTPADPPPVADWIVEPKLSEAVKGNGQVNNIQSVPARLAVILHYVLGIQIDNGLAGCVLMKKM